MSKLPWLNALSLFCLQAIYSMVCNTGQDEDDTPQTRTEEIFEKMDTNKDGVLCKQEFVNGCMSDQFLYQMLTADQSTFEWFLSLRWPAIHVFNESSIMTFIIAVIFSLSGVSFSKETRKKHRGLWYSFVLAARGRASIKG